MANKQIRIEGDERLLRQLKELDARTRGAILASIVQAAAKPVEEVARQKAPVDTGDLARSITTEMLERKPHVATAGVGPTKQIWYAHFPEFGTVKSQARPYLRPAYDEKKRDAVREMRRGLREQIDAARRTR